MQARIHIHPAGSDWRGGSPIDAEGISLGAAAGANPPSLSFSTRLDQRPRPRLDHATLVIDDHAVETIFTPVQRGATMLSGDDFGGTSNTCVAAMAHLAEIADTGGWPHADLDAFAAAAQAYIATRPGFAAATGITADAFTDLAFIDTLGSSTVASNAGSVDAFGDEIQHLLGAIGRYALTDGMPIDWWMDTARRLRAATPLRPAPNAALDIIAGSNADAVTQSDDLGIGRVASRVIIGSKGSTFIAELPGAFPYGEIDAVAASGSASAIVTAMGAQLRTFGITIGEDLATVERGVPSLWIGDRVRVRDLDGAWARCAIINASLSVADGGRGVTISATAVEGDW